MENRYLQCPICFSTRIKSYGYIHNKYAPDLHTKWDICMDCKAIFANPVASDKELTYYYKDKYYITNEQKGTISKALQKLYKNNLKRIKKYFPNFVTFLEIGCGKGEFLKYIYDGKIKITAIDLNAEILNTIKKTIPDIKTYACSFEDINFTQGENFDIIYLWHVIEHFKNIHKEIEKIRSLQKSGGVLIIGTPAVSITDSLRMRVNYFTKGMCKINTSPDHTFYLKNKILKNILIKHGYKIVYSRIYMDNVHGNLRLSNNIAKFFLLNIFSLITNFFHIPLIGKQIIIARKN